MKNPNNILLPGLNEQINFLLKRLNLSDLNVLVIGSGSGVLFNKLSKKSSKRIEVIVEDYEALINFKMLIGKNDKVQVRIMSYESTDFENEQFDLVFAQASISNYERKNIIKEVKRILNPNGILCVGEIVKLQEEIPSFVNDIFNSSDIDPLKIDTLENFYTDRNFELIDSINLSHTLKEFYSIISEKLKSKSGGLSDSERSYYKKVMSQIKHESNAYLKLGADKFIGFKTLILKKK